MGEKRSRNRIFLFYISKISRNRYFKLYFRVVFSVVYECPNSMTQDSSNESKLTLQNEKGNGDLIVGMREGRRKDQVREVVYTILTFSQSKKM